MPGFFDYLQQPDQNAGMFGGIGNFLNNNSNALIGLGAGIARGGNINDVMSNGIGGFGQGRQSDIKLQQQGLMFQGFVSSGLTPQQAMVAVLNPEWGKSAMPFMFPKSEFMNVNGRVLANDPARGTSTQTANVPEIVKTGPGEKAESITPEMAATNAPVRAPTAPQAYPSTAPRPYTGAPAKQATSGLILGLPGDPQLPPSQPSGQPRVTPLTSNPPLPKEVDLGTEIALIDPQTGREIKRFPKDLQGKMAAEQRGTLGGQAQVALPDTIAKAQTALDTITQIKSHPDKSFALSVPGLAVGQIPKTSSYAFNSLVDQAKNQSFLQAYETLKGAGAITEVEGAKATQAITRLNTKLSETEFDKALKDLEGVVRAGMGRARLKAAYGSGDVAPVAPVGGPSDPLGIR